MGGGIDKCRPQVYAKHSGFHCYDFSLHVRPIEHILLNIVCVFYVLDVYKCLKQCNVFFYFRPIVHLLTNQTLPNAALKFELHTHIHLGL